MDGKSNVSIVVETKQMSDGIALTSKHYKCVLETSLVLMAAHSVDTRQNQLIHLFSSKSSLSYSYVVRTCTYLFFFLFLSLSVSIESVGKRISYPQTLSSSYFHFNFSFFFFSFFVVRARLHRWFGISHCRLSPLSQTFIVQFQLFLCRFARICVAPKADFVVTSTSRKKTFSIWCFSPFRFAATLLSFATFCSIFENTTTEKCTSKKSVSHIQHHSFEIDVDAKQWWRSVELFFLWLIQCLLIHSVFVICNSPFRVY